MFSNRKVAVKPILKINTIMFPVSSLENIDLSKISFSIIYVGIKNTKVTIYINRTIKNSVRFTAILNFIYIYNFYPIKVIYLI